MNVLLIAPKARLLGYSKLFNDDEIGLGLVYIAASSIKNGHDTKVILSSPSEASAAVREFMPRVVGLSSVTATYLPALDIARAVKAEDPSIVTVMGGHHVTFTAEDVLAEEAVDYVIRGEGDEVFPLLLEAVDNGEKHPQIEGVRWSEKNGITGGSSIIAHVNNLDSLPCPDQSLLRNPKRALLIGSRGCPFKCTFCSVAQFYRGSCKRRSIDSIIGELRQISKTGRYKKVEFRDDNLMVDTSWGRDLCSAITREGFDFSWHCLLRTDTISRDPGLLPAMKASGCAIAGLGLESGVQEIIDSYKKGTSISQAYGASNQLRDKSILQIWYAMIGSGDEYDTPEYVEKNIDFLCGFPFDLMQISLLTPFPGTPFFEKIAAENRLVHKNWDLYDGMHCVYEPKGMSREALEQKLFYAYKKVFIKSGLKRILHTIFSARHFIGNTINAKKFLKVIINTLILRKDVLS